MQRSAIGFLVMVSAATERPAGGQEVAADWPTVAGNLQRTNFTPAHPRPPLRLRWIWVNGAPISNEHLAKSRSSARIALEALPNFYTARFAPLAQPVVRRGEAYIGSVGGEVFAIDLASGQTKWKAAASGPILHCVTVGPEAVYAATLRGIDAFSLDGKKLWTLRCERLGSFYCCPAHDGTTVLAGSLAGNFYGIDAATGEARWSQHIGAPIYHCPAVHDGKVIFGAEDMHVYALDVATGKEVWKSPRLPGVSFGHYWPVVAAKAGKLLVRTSPYVKTAGSSVMGSKDVPFDYDKSQEVLREYFKENPDLRDFFVLDLSDGTEAVRVATGHAGSQGDLTPPAIVRDDGSALAWHYAKEGAFQKSGQWGHYDRPMDLGTIDFTTGRFRRLGPTGTTAPPAITRNDDYHQNSMGGKYLWGVQNRLQMGMVAIDGTSADFRGWQMHGVVRDFQKQGLVGFLGRCEAGAVGPSITADVVLSNPHDGLYILAFESAASNADN